jgi:hypothetical protein
MTKPIRWSEKDHYFGPFTYAIDGWRKFAVILGSGDGYDYPGCRLRISLGTRTLILALPPIIKPWRRWVNTSHYSWSDNPAGGYWDTGEREYGFTITDGFLSVALGRVTNDSSTEQRWGYFLPWTQWRHVRRSFYGLAGEHIATLPDTGNSYLGDPARWDRERAIEDAAPTVTFYFRDFDGEALSATTRIEEREWRFGTGWWKWLSLSRRPKVSRSLAITFSGEVGKHKGSWKGGTIGHAIEMNPGELHEAAFRRYCAEHDLTFDGVGLKQNANSSI